MDRDIKGVGTLTKTRFRFSLSSFFQKRKYKN